MYTYLYLTRFPPSTLNTVSLNVESDMNYLSFCLFLTYQGIGGGVPRQCTDYMAEILFALNRHDVTSLSRWMQVSCMSADLSLVIGLITFFRRRVG